MKARKLSKENTAAAKGGYQWEGRRQSANIFDRRPGSINIGPNTGRWYNGDRKMTSGVNVRSEMGTGQGGRSSGANRARSGRGLSV